MKPPEVRKYLFDIWQACELLTQFCAGKTLDDYRGDVLLRSAIERQFEIVGEALNQAIKLDADVAIQVSDSGRIIAFRAYSAVSNEVVWGIVEVICQGCALRYGDSWKRRADSSRQAVAFAEGRDHALLVRGSARFRLLENTDSTFRTSSAISYNSDFGPADPTDRWLAPDTPT